MKRLVIAIALVLAGSALEARGQTTGTPTGKAPGESGPGSGLGRGQGGQHQVQSPDKIAEELLKKFDADGDGELSQTELAQALETLGEHHRTGGGGHGGKHGRGGAKPHGGSGTQGNPDSFGTSGAQTTSGTQGSSETHASSGAQGNSSTQGTSIGQASSNAQGGNEDRPSSDEIATKLIEKYASDKKGLKLDELTTAIKEHRANQGQGESQ